MIKLRNDHSFLSLISGRITDPASIKAVNGVKFCLKTSVSSLSFSASGHFLSSFYASTVSRMGSAIEWSFIPDTRVSADFDCPSLRRS